MQLYFLVAARSEQRVGQAPLVILPQERRRQPERFVAVQESSHLALIAQPPGVDCRCAGARVTYHSVTAFALSVNDIPPMT